MKWSYTDKETTPDEVAEEVGPGWRPLVKELIVDLQALGWDGQVAQVKEKFGGLRFYIENGSDAIHNRINKAENDSMDICEDCGKPGKRTNRKGSGWIKTLCEEHSK